LREKINKVSIDAQSIELPKLHGKAVIQLFDESGKEVNRVEEENMVTNALTNFLNVPASWNYNYNGTSSIMPYCYYSLYYSQPFYSKVYAGVLLFDDTITEDADLILPPKNVNGVGNAGGVYSGTNTFRGSLNSNESGAITNGYRYVWDFATDRANGLIKSLALTSLMGGNIGWSGHQESLYSYNDLFNGQSFVGAFDSTTLLSCGLGSMLPYTTSGVLELIYGTESYLLARGNTSNKVYKINREPKSALKLMSSMNVITDVEELFTVDANACIYVEQNKINTVALSSTTEITHKKYTLVGVLENTNTITLDTACYSLSSNDTYGNYRPFYWNGNYYASLASGQHCLAKFSSTGVLTETYTYTGGVSSLYVDDKSGTGIAVYRDLLNALVLNEDGIKAYSKPNHQGIMKYEGANLPNVMTYTTSSSNNSITLYGSRFNGYLGTINNLASPVTKTSSNTMKITYELTEAT
jgi:hypothetical protein